MQEKYLIFNTLVATVSCGYLPNALLTVAKPFELGILVYSDLKSRETSMASLGITRSWRWQSPYRHMFNL